MGLSLYSVTGLALDIQDSPVRVYLAHAGQPGQAGSDHPAEKQPKSLLKTQENRKANLLPEIGNFREQPELSKSANVEGITTLREECKAVPLDDLRI